MSTKRSLLHVSVSDPVVVAQAAPEVRRWGHWQFPSVERLENGLLHVSYSIEDDSVTTYGMPVGHAVSENNGNSWRMLAPSLHVDGGGILLPNGDRLRTFSKRPETPDAALPANPIAVLNSYGTERRIFLDAEMPEAYRGWFFERKKKGEWVKEQAAVHFPGETRILTQGALPYNTFSRIRQAPDGSLLGIGYYYLPDASSGGAKYCPAFFESLDSGSTWRLLGTIPYRGDDAADPKADIREGFSEPDIAWAPDGSLFCLLRTTDGHGIGPMYYATSRDNGATWSTPQIYDGLGVWPNLVVLGNGATIASYGRPGLYAAISSDPGIGAYERKLEIVPPGPYQTETCSYSALLALDEQTALIVYSDFNYPDKQGNRCKTIMSRTIKIELQD